MIYIALFLDIFLLIYDFGEYIADKQMTNNLSFNDLFFFNTIKHSLIALQKMMKFITGKNTNTRFINTISLFSPTLPPPNTVAHIPITFLLYLYWPRNVEYLPA